MKKDKIIVFLSADFTHFAIIYFLQKKFDCDLYAVIDITNKPKVFFETQQLIKFKKVWYFHDAIDRNYRISNTNALNKFEEKYELNLWRNLINERIFYRFFHFHKFSRIEMLSLAEQQLTFFEKILDETNPDFLITEAPVLFHSEMLYQMSKKRNVKCLLLSMPKLGGKTLISEIAYKIDYVDNLENLPYTTRSAEDIHNYLKKTTPRKVFEKYFKNLSDSKIQMILALIQYLTSSNAHEKTHYTYYGRTKFTVLSFTLNLLFKKKLREFFMAKNLLKDIQITESYVYFPMSVDMERNVLIDTPFYTNQIEIIRAIAKSLPVNYRLIVKENPGQIAREWRPLSDYKEIMSIPNVSLVHPAVNGLDLIKNSSLVISLAGSSPLEAAFHQKPSIVFGNVIYSLIPSIVKATNIEELPNLIRKMLTIKADLVYLNRFIDLIENNAVTFDLFEFQTLFNNQFYYQGSLFDVKINEEELKLFLDNVKENFDELVDYHIKKIHQHKEKMKTN